VPSFAICEISGTLKGLVAPDGYHAVPEFVEKGLIPIKIELLVCTHAVMAEAELRKPGEL
jgi:hypothetical protein